MKKSISDLYEQILLSEAEKNSLQNPSNDEVGDLPSENMFGSVPGLKKGEGPEKAKLQKGPSYNKVDTGSAVTSKQTNSTFPKSKPAKSASVEQGIEMEDEDVVPEDEEMEDHDSEITFKKKDKPQEESFTMSAFEELFKKTINEELNDEIEDIDADIEDEDIAPEDEDIDEEEAEEEEEEEELEEEEEDLVSDLRALQDKLNSILDKLETAQSQEEELESEEEGEEYSEEEFDDEFGEEEEMPVKESKQSNLKPVNKAKIKTLQNKKNKVGKISPKGGKAKASTLKVTANPTLLGDKKKDLQKHNNKVKSSVDKGEFFK